MTPTQIKQAYESVTSEKRYFFSRDTMRFFGDHMSSYGARKVNGVQYLYRKPDSMVNVFGKWKRAGRQFFNAWRFDPETKDLNHCKDDETGLVWEALYGDEED